MRLLFTVVALCCVVFAPPPATAADVAIGETKAVYSQVLGEERTLQIALPESYARSHTYHRYPVLYLLDGDKFFAPFVGAVQHMSSDASPRIPEMIVVGITNRNWGAGRIRNASPTRSLIGASGKVEADYAASGGADDFLAFIKTELMPYIERHYSASDYRMLVGYSFTGLLPLHALFTQPDLFDAYLSIDPSWWWDDYHMEKAARTFIATAKVSRKALFVATTSNNPPAEYFPVRRYVDTLASMLKRSPVAGLDVGSRIYKDETHHSLGLRSLYDGLSHVFRGYMPSQGTLYRRPQDLQAQYETLSRRLGTDVFLGEGLLNWFGYFFLAKPAEVGKAVTYFELATKHYPQSPNAWDSLAEAMLATGEAKRALEYYERSLQLNPGNKNAAARMKTLRADKP